MHAAGYKPEIDKIVEIAHAHGIKIIEDRSQSHFAKHKAKAGRHFRRHRRIFDHRTGRRT
jgi:dTDP-4-amino-4,6-dideoxygalactose transaminase